MCALVVFVAVAFLILCSPFLSTHTILQDLTKAAFQTGALHELRVALTWGNNEVVYREALAVYAMAGAAAATVGAVAATAACKC